MHYHDDDIDQELTEHEENYREESTLLSELYRRALSSGDIARAKQIHAYLLRLKRREREYEALRQDSRLLADDLDSY